MVIRVLFNAVHYAKPLLSPDASNPFSPIVAAPVQAHAGADPGLR
jgi:hypothetical protein